MKAIILAGGKGERLKNIINDIPKPMAPIAGKPFLEYLVLQLGSWDIKDIILSVGYRKESIISYFTDGSKWDLNIIYVPEDLPLGTGGAVKNAEKMINSSPILVMNGDSFCPLDLNKFIGFHRQKKALASIALAESDDTKDYGKIVLDSSERIMKFSEKSEGTGKSFINTGIYLFEKEVFSMIPPDSKCSLEYDIFPKLVGKAFYGFSTNEMLMDIGTPERYQYAKRYFEARSSSVNLKE